MSSNFPWDRWLSAPIPGSSAFQSKFLGFFLANALPIILLLGVRKRTAFSNEIIFVKTTCNKTMMIPTKCDFFYSFIFVILMRVKGRKKDTSGHCGCSGRAEPNKNEKNTKAGRSVRTREALLLIHCYIVKVMKQVRMVSPVSKWTPFWVHDNLPLLETHVSPTL